jgi:hypothetical protein
MLQGGNDVGSVSCDAISLFPTEVLQCSWYARCQQRGDQQLRSNSDLVVVLRDFPMSAWQPAGGPCSYSVTIDTREVFWRPCQRAGDQRLVVGWSSPSHGHDVGVAGRVREAGPEPSSWGQRSSVTTDVHAAPNQPGYSA